MFKTLRTVIYKVQNITEARDWYADITGKQPYFDQPFYVGFDINGCELGLDPDLNDAASGSQAVAYWAVDNIQQQVDTLISNGAELVQPVTNVGGPIHVAVIKDPFGNTLGLIEGA